MAEEVPPQLYFPRKELLDKGFSEPLVRALEQAALVGQLIVQQGNADEQIDIINEDLEDAALSLQSLDIRVDDLEDFANDGPYAPLAGATFTGPVQATEYRVSGTKVVGAQGASVADAAGGATVDTEARAAINTLLARLRAHGLIAT